MEVRATTRPVEPAGAINGLRLRSDGHWLGVCLLTVVAAGAYGLYSVVRFATFRATTYDLVIFDQAIRGYAVLRAPVSIAKGVHNEFGVGFSVLGDHFSPILAVLAPLYWIHDHPTTLLIAQGVLLALAIPPLWVFARRALGTVPAYLIAMTYAISMPVQHAMSFDFHEVAFAPPLLALMLERAHAGRNAHAAAAACLLLLVKEDMGLAVAGFGLYLLATGGRRLGAGLVVAGIAQTWVATKLIIPAFGGKPDYYWHYDALGDTVPSAAWYTLTHPIDVLQIATDPAIKVHTLLWLFAPLLFFSLFSPMIFPAIPLLAERMLATDMPTWWTSVYHYDAFVVVPILFAAVDGAARLARLGRFASPLRRFPSPLGRFASPLGRFASHVATPHRLAVGWAVVVAAIGIVLLVGSPLAQLTQPRWFRGDGTVAAAREAVTKIPDGARVEAVNNVGPHLTSRTAVLLWDRAPRQAPWVVADVWRWQFPFVSLDEQRHRVRYLATHGYRIVFEQGGYVVLHREGR
jgi:uncharacterized membrane protein